MIFAFEYFPFYPKNQTSYFFRVDFFLKNNLAYYVKVNTIINALELQAP